MKIQELKEREKLERYTKGQLISIILENRDDFDDYTEKQIQRETERIKYYVDMAIKSTKDYKFKRILDIINKIKNCDLVCEEDDGLGRNCGYDCEQVNKIIKKVNGI